MRDFSKFIKGIRLPDNNEGPNAIGDLSGSLDALDNGAIYHYQDIIRAFLGGSERQILTNDQTQTITNKTIDATAATGTNTLSADASDIVYDDSVSSLGETDVQAAIAALKVLVDLKAEDTDLLDHVNASEDVHGVGVGNAVVGTGTSQTLTNKTIDADANTITNIDNADIKAAAGIDATKIADGSVSNTEFQTLDGVTSSIQDQLDDKVGRIVSTDNAVAKYDGIDGSVQDSGVIISDTDEVSGVAKLSVDNVEIDGNEITTTSGDLELDSATNLVITNADGLIANRTLVTGQFEGTGGANATLDTVNAKLIKLTNATLTSVTAIPAPSGLFGQEITLSNDTGNRVQILNDAGATTANRILTGTGANLALEPNASVNLVYDLTASRWKVVGGTGGGGAGGGGLDTFHTQDMEGLSDVSEFSTGNNITFLGGGTIQGALSLEETLPIAGTKSLKYIQAVGSANDYFASDIIDVDIKQRNNTAGMTFYFQYDGNDNDGRFIVYDVTNAQEISTEVAFVKLSNKAQRYSLSFYIPESCEEIRYGYQVINENDGAELIIDDVEFSVNPFKEGDLLQTQSSFINVSGAPNSANLAANDNFPEGGGLYSLGTSGTITILQKCNFSVSLRILFANKNINQNMQINHSRYGEVVRVRDRPEGTAQTGVYLSASSEIACLPGDEISFSATTNSSVTGSRIAITATAPTAHIITPVDTFSTDTAPLTYAPSSQFTLSTLSDAPVGTFITFTYAANSFNRTQTTTAPTQTTADMNQNGIRIFTRIYTAASTAAQPSAVAIQIGKGFKGVQLGLYKSPSKDIAGSLDYAVISNNAIQSGARYRDYNENTGILLVDVGDVISVNTAIYTLGFVDRSAQNNGYLTINASKSAALTAVPTPLVAYIKDVKPSGTAGGTFTSGAWQTRDLNTLEGDTSFVSLSSNQFTLPSGRYEIEASAPALRATAHKTRLFNVTSSETIIVGTSEICTDAAGPDGNRSFIEGSFSLSTPSTFEIQHRAGTTFLNSGFGIASSFGEDELYTQIKLKKVG